MNLTEDDIRVAAETDLVTSGSDADYELFYHLK